MSLFGRPSKASDAALAIGAAQVMGVDPNYSAALQASVPGMAGGGLYSGPSHRSNPLDAFVDPMRGGFKPIARLLMRLGVFDNHAPRALGLEVTHIGKVNIIDVVPVANGMAVFAVVDGKAMVLEDELALYPSDALVSRINLLRD